MARAHRTKTTRGQLEDNSAMYLEDAFSNRFTVMHEKINVLFDYFHGHKTGIDVIDYAIQIKKDSDAIIKQMPCSGVVDVDLSIASKTLVSLKNIDNTTGGRTKHAKQAKLLRARKPNRKITNIKVGDAAKNPNGRKKRTFAKRILSDEDLVTIKNAVKELGGAENVGKLKRWRHIAKRIRTEEELKKQTSAGSDIKKIFHSIVS